MPIEKITPVLNITNVEESFKWFELFGWTPDFTWNEAGLIGTEESALPENDQGPATFAGIRSGEIKMFLCVGAQGSRGTRLPSTPGDDGTDGVWMTWWVSSKNEVDAFYETAVEHNLIVTHPPTDEPWGVREFHLRHPDGHTFRVSCGLD